MTESKRPPRTRVMGIREKDGDGEAEYGGSFGGGQSRGGAYATPHGTKADVENKIGKPIGGQSVQGYHGGGQAGADNRGADDHHAATRGEETGGSAATYRDHPSQRDDE